MRKSKSLQSHRYDDVPTRAIKKHCSVQSRKCSPLTTWDSTCKNGPTCPQLLLQAQLAATAATPGHPDMLPDSPEGAEQSASPDSPQGSPEAAAQDSFQMDESPIRGLLVNSSRAAARRSERLAAAAAAREAAAAAAAAEEAASDPKPPAKLVTDAAAAEALVAASESVPPADLVTAVAASARRGGCGARCGGWTPRGSSSSSGSADGGCTVRLARSAGQPAAPKTSRSSSSSRASSGSNHSLGRELERFACGSAPRQPPAAAVVPAPPAGSPSEGAGSNMVVADDDPRAAGSGALLDVVYDLQGGACGACDTVTDDAASASGSPGRSARGWAGVHAAAGCDADTGRVLGPAAASSSGTAGSSMSTTKAMSLSRFAGHCYAQLCGGGGVRSAAGVSTCGGLLCVGLLLAARQRRALMAGFRFLLRIFRLYRATLLRLQ